MQNPHAPKGAAVTYAVLTLVVRLVASQCDVLGLWFSRRAYERSRGEMITMLYEKTLSRKVVTVDSNTKDEAVIEASDDRSEPNDTPNTSKGVWLRIRRTWKRFQRSLFSSRKELADPQKAKQPASMGKILNLMRYDCRATALFWLGPNCGVQQRLL